MPCPRNNQGTLNVRALIVTFFSLLVSTSVATSLPTPMHISARKACLRSNRIFAPGFGILFSPRLRGGEDDDSVDHNSTDGRDDEKIPEYAGEQDEVSPYSVWALDAVQIRMNLRGSAAQSWRGKPFAPLFAHQIFGPDEEITGYEKPSVGIVYASDTLVTGIEFSHEGKVSETELDKHGLSHTNVANCIKTHAPSDYINASRLPNHMVATTGTFKPPGNLLVDYTEHQLGCTEEDIKRSKEECGGGEVRYVAYHWNSGEEQDEGARSLVKRVQSLAMWMIETASYIDETDSNWSCILLYEQVGGADAGSPPDYHLVGFTTLYRSSLATLNATELEELTPLHDEVQDQADMVRLRISQFVILPPYAHKGHGTQLLKSVYKLAKRDKNILDVTVEAPSEAFIQMRTRCDAEVLRDADLLEALQGENPPWTDIHRSTKLSMVQLFHLAEAVGSEAAGRRGVKPAVENTSYPTLLGIEVDLDFVYERSSVLGFTRNEVDDILHAIRSEDLEGTHGPRDAAQRLLTGVYLAVVADLGQAEGLSDEEVDALLDRIDSEELCKAGSPHDVAKMVHPLVHKMKAEKKKRMAEK